MNDIHELLDNSHRSISHGVVYIAIKKHADTITAADVNKISTYKTKGNVEALAIAGSLIKAVKQQIIAEPGKLAPNLTFTIFFHQDGEADRVQVNDFSRTAFKK